ncbi:MAG: hypothetical protein KKI08_18135 [Armatimonadetes bacterium]|nr:hypothetical protein [Armatimonadota bacterium]
MRRQLPLIIGFLTGLFMFVQFFVPHQAGVAGFDLLNDWVRVIGAFAMVLGIASIFQANWEKIRRRQREYGYSIVTLASFLLMVWVGLFRPGEVPLPLGWGLNGESDNLQGVWDRQVGHAAPGAVKLHGTNKAAAGEWSNRWPGWQYNWGNIAIPPGAEVRLKAWARGTVADGPGAAVSLAFLDKHNEPVAGGSFASDPVKLTEPWRELTVAGRAPRDAAWLQISLGLQGEGTVWFDDVALADSAGTVINPDFGRAEKHSLARRTLDQAAGPGFKWLFDTIVVPLDSTMFALLAFFMASAAYRTFRARTPEATVLLLVAVIVMIGRVPIGELFYKHMPQVSEWFMMYPTVAAKRGILFGVALGSIATSLRIILGIERSHLGGR